MLTLTPEEVWNQAVAGMAKENPHADDAGMDGTRAWGRLYWSGPLFSLLAEISIIEIQIARVRSATPFSGSTT